MINVEQIKDKVSEAIKYCGYTQTAIAKAIGVSQAMISDYLRKRKTPQIETLANLCQFLDLDANDILCIRTTIQQNTILDQSHNNGTINNNF